MKRKGKKILIISGVAFLSLILLLIGTLLFFYYNKPLTKRVLLGFVSRRVDFSISVEKLDYTLFPLRLWIQGVRISRKSPKEEMDISVRRIEAAGEIRRILKKEKPSFDSITLFEPTFYVRREPSGGNHSSNPLAGLSEVAGKLDARSAALRLELSGLEAELQNFNLSLEPADLDGDYHYLLDLQKAWLKTDDFRVTSESGLHTSGTFSPESITFYETEFQLDTIHFAGVREELSFEKVMVRTQGEYRSAGGELHLSKLEIDVPNLFRAAGPIKVHLEEPLLGTCQPKAALSDLNRCLNILRPYLPDELKYLQIQGTASFEGEASFKIKEKLKIFTRLNVDLKPSAIVYVPPEFALRSTLSGKLQVEAVGEKISVSGFLNLREGFFGTKNLTVEHISLDLPFRLTPSSVRSQQFKGRVENLSLEVQNNRFAFDEVTFIGRGGYDLRNSLLVLDSLEIEARRLPELRLEARVNLRPGREKSFHLQTGKMGVEDLTSLFRPYFPQAVFAWEPEGLVEVDIESDQKPQTPDDWNFSARISFDQGSFHHPEFTLLSEGLSPNVSVTGNYAMSGKFLAFSLAFHLTEGETLWRDFYHNWHANPLDVEVQAECSLPLEEIRVLSADISVDPLGKVRSSGALRWEKSIPLDLEVFWMPEEPNDLVAFLTHSTDVSPPPFYFSGSWDGRFHLRKREDFFLLQGQFFIKEGGLENSDGSASLEGINARLPFIYQAGEERSTEVLPQEGYLRADALRTSFITIVPFEIDLVSRPNTWQVTPLSFSLWGGNCSLGEALISLEPESLDASGLFSLFLTDADLSLLPLPSKDFMFNGRMTAVFDPVEVTSELAIFEGSLKAELFSGKAVVDKIKIENPFAKSRILSFDVSFQDINLEQLTDALPFGRVTGIINGEIEGLGFSYGQPERGLLRLESVKKKGIPQTFSLKAVDDITIISSGKSYLPSQSFVLRAFSSFAYSKMGFRCSLKNDVFTLNGLIKEDEGEYLVKKAWPFGINIINRDPKNRISFKDMVNRLKRVAAPPESR